MTTRQQLARRIRALEVRADAAGALVQVQERAVKMLQKAAKTFKTAHKRLQGSPHLKTNEAEEVALVIHQLAMKSVNTFKDAAELARLLSKGRSKQATREAQRAAKRYRLPG
jgi:hypothetical protein